MKVAEEIDIPTWVTYLLYALLVIVIGIVGFATLVKFDVVFAEVGNKDVGNNTNENNANNKIVMTCVYNTTQGSIKATSTSVFTFNDNKLKRSRAIADMSLIKPGVGIEELEVYPMIYSMMQSSLSNIDGVDIDSKSTDNSFSYEIDIDHTLVKEEQLTQLNGSKMSIDYKLNESMNEVKQKIMTDTPEAKCDK